MKFKQHCKIVRSKVKIFEKIRLPFTVKAICLALLKLAVCLKSNETVACFKKFISIKYLIKAEAILGKKEDVWGYLKSNIRPNICLWLKRNLKLNLSERRCPQMKFQFLCKLSTRNIFEWFLVLSSHRTRKERNLYKSFKISYRLSFGTNSNLNNLYLSNFFGSIVDKNSAKQSSLMNETAGAFYVSSFSVSCVAASKTLSSHVLENLTVILDKWWW